MILELGQAESAVNPGNPLFSSFRLALLVGIGACLATFVASLMAEEQNQRLRQGVFGTVAGSAMGALASLLTKDNSLIVVGFLGSTVGAILGWLCSLLLSIWAATSETGRTVLEYQVGGWQAVRRKLSLDNDHALQNALELWLQSFRRRTATQKESVLYMQRGPNTNSVIQMVLQEWLVSFVDTLGLLFHIAKRDELRSRVTIIVFGKRGTDIVGKHWISDSGPLPSHNTLQEFNIKSIGYQVLTGALPSPHFATLETANQQGQERGSGSYRPFLSFRLDSNTILAIDWPADLKEPDHYVKKTKDLFQMDLAPAIGSLLSHWDGAPASAMNLDPLQ